MSKKSLILISSSIVVVAAIIALLIVKPGKKQIAANVVKAIPTNTPMFLKANNIDNISETIAQSTVANQLFTNEGFNAIQKFANTFDSLTTQLPELVGLLNEDAITVAFSYGGKKELTTTYYLKLRISSNIKKINTSIKQFLSKHKFSLNNRNYNNTTIYEIIDQSQHKLFSFSVYKGVLIVSRKGFMVENSLRQLDETTFQTTPEFEVIRKTANSSADINLFINHKFSDQLFNSLLSKNIENFIKHNKEYTSWSELDINLENHKVLFNGFSIANKNYSLFSKVLEKQKPVSNDMENILPSSISFFNGLFLSDVEQFFDDYEQFKKEQNELLIRENKLNNISTEFEGGIQKLFKTIMNGEIGSAGFNIDNNNPSNGRIWLISTHSGSQTLEYLKEVQNNFIQNHKEKLSEWRFAFEIDAETSYSIYKWPYKQMPKALFGDLFENIEAGYFTIINNYLVFADSQRTLQQVIMASVHDDLLSKNSNYQKFKSSSENKSNYTFFINTEYALNYSNLLLNENISKGLLKNKENYKIKALGWQISPTNKMLYNTGAIIYSEKTKSKPKTVWQSSLDNGFEFKPQFTINHNDPANKEIVIQDLDNNFYLINNIGRVLWKINLDSKIIGEIHQIDIYNNGKLQYLFNTKNKLYLLDRNGDNVSGFPINLKSAATNGVSVFDYDNNNNYRFFISGIDRKIYGFDRSGKTLKGWNQFQTEHLVSTPIKHFRVANKDYITATDGMKDYILNRKGSVRVTTQEIYSHGNNSELFFEKSNSDHAARLVTTDDKGTLHFTYFDGSHETMTFENFDINHFFTTDDLNGDGKNEYILTNAETLFIFDASGKKLLKHKFDDRISFPPNAYTFSSTNRKIGVVIGEKSKIHLIDIEGNNHYGFPLEGNSPFSIGFISDKNENFNLLVSSRDNYLYNYFVE